MLSLILSLWWSIVPPHPLDPICARIMQVESNMDPNAVGDHGLAVGILQIHPIMVRDVNRVGGTTFMDSDRTSVIHSILMFRIYSEHYTPSLDPELVARRWNGGPRGHLNPATLPYWSRIQETHP